MFPYTLSDDGATVMIDGRPRLFSTVHPSYAGILEAIDSGNEAQILALVDVKANVFTQTLGRVEILDNTVLVAGKEQTGALVDRILEMVARGSNAVDGYINFLDRVCNNPSKTAKDETYLFIEACNLPITSEGFFLAYKRVDNDYMDIFTGKISNRIGETPEMDRNDVDDNRSRTCSEGLHFCSYDYLPHYGGNGGNRVMVVEIDPANVVAIPDDYKNAKGRTWTYKVVGEIEDWKGERITPWFTDEYSDSDDDLEPGDDFDEDTGEIFDEDEFDAEFEFVDLDIYTDLLEEHADEVHGEAEVTDVPAPDGITAKVSENGVTIIVEDDVDQEVVDEFMSDISGLVSRALDETEDEDAPEPIDTSTTDAPETTPDSVKRQKLSPNDVRAIRVELADTDATYAQIATRFGVHRRTIEKIDKGLIWSSVT